MRASIWVEGGTTFTFVTGGIQSVLEQARRSARGKDIALAGGGSASRQYLSAGLVDEMEISLVPILLSAGERLFDGVAELGGLELVRTIAAPGVVHLKFAPALNVERAMVTYEVTTTVPEALAEAYSRYMREHHVPDLLKTGCFHAATFYQAGSGRYRTCYEAETERDIERYVAEHAARLRADAASRFPDAAVTSREVWHTVQRWEG